ncbi:hypothetical protein [Streptomyces celluloflavus]|uniref:hypothetical protein n=1 Tax=Streptomyces celluloflavus TaxID=58344 RepID=UPI0036918C70
MERPASFRDTAAFHLANSQDLWSGGTDAAPEVRRPGTGSRTRAVTPPPRAPGDTPRASVTARPPAPAEITTPAIRTGVVPAPTVPATPATPAVPPGAPAGARRVRVRAAAAAVCLVLGIGLIGGAAAGSWLANSSDARPAAEAAFTKGRDVWHNAPVDTLFPRTLNSLGTGPGGADRHWTRIAVAPDNGCAGAFDPLLAKALSPVGCARLLRATYADATRTGVVTVGAQITTADRTAMQALHARFGTEKLTARTDLMPRPYPAQGTLAAGFGTAQRASWSVRVLTDLPVVVYAVSGFADGRAVADPQDAEAATRPGATSTPAQSGLGHGAKDLADHLEAAFRKASAGTPRATEATK